MKKNWINKKMVKDNNTVWSYMTTWMTERRLYEAESNGKKE